jgi:hypothetical protein
VKVRKVNEISDGRGGFNEISLKSEVLGKFAQCLDHAIPENPINWSFLGSILCP